MIRFRLPLCLIATVGTFASAALADGSPKPRAKIMLPGVDGNYQIVKPLSSGADEQPENTSGGQFKIGNMDVRIGGNITVDVGAGTLSRPRR